MSEAKIIHKTKMPNTIKSIKQDLLDLGVRNGDVLLVHSALSSLGWVCGGPQAVVMALRQAVGDDGTLVMPAHSGDWSDPAEWTNPPVPKEWIPTIYEAMPVYDPQLTPTRGMGRIAELFRTFPGTVRSSHPQSSISAQGRLANEIIADHPLTPQFGMDSPLGKLYALNARVLLLGVGYDSCTCFHLAEYMFPEMHVQKMGAAILQDGKKVWQWFEDFNYDSVDFDLIGNDFEVEHDVQIGFIGNAESRLFSLKDGVDFAKVWLEHNRFAKNHR